MSVNFGEQKNINEMSIKEFHDTQVIHTLANAKKVSGVDTLKTNIGELYSTYKILQNKVVDKERELDKKTLGVFRKALSNAVGDLDTARQDMAKVRRQLFVLEKDLADAPPIKQQPIDKKLIDWNAIEKKYFTPNQNSHMSCMRPAVITQELKSLSSEDLQIIFRNLDKVLKLPGQYKGIQFTASKWDVLIFINMLKDPKFKTQQLLDLLETNGHFSIPWDTRTSFDAIKNAFTLKPNEDVIVTRNLAQLGPRFDIKHVPGPSDRNYQAFQQFGDLLKRPMDEETLRSLFKPNWNGTFDVDYEKVALKTADKSQVPIAELPESVRESPGWQGRQAYRADNQERAAFLELMKGQLKKLEYVTPQRQKTALQNFGLLPGGAQSIKISEEQMQSTEFPSFLSAMALIDPKEIDKVEQVIKTIEEYFDLNPDDGELTWKRGAYVFNDSDDFA